MLNDWYQSIHNLELHSFRNLYCYIPEESNEEFKKDIKAVLAKNNMNYKSVDYVLKIQEKFQVVKKKANPYGTLLAEILDTIWENVTDLNLELTNLELKEENIITLGLTSTFLRLQNSYECIVFLIKNQFFFESNSINRVIFEQLNYNFNLAQFSPNEFEKLSQNQLKKLLSPTNINKLKSFLKISSINQFYSILSDLTHIGIKQSHEYISFNKEINEYVVTKKNIAQTIVSAIYLLYNVDLHRIVFEYCFINNSNITTYALISTNNSFIVNPKRDTVQKYNEFIERFNVLLDEIEIEKKVEMKKQTKHDEDDLPF
jgi:hypothetical protein